MKFFFGFLMGLSLSAQAPPARPKVLGVAHYSIFVSDLAKARAFYEDFLGYEESFTLSEVRRHGADGIRENQRPSIPGTGEPAEQR